MKIQFDTKRKIIGGIGKNLNVNIPEVFKINGGNSRKSVCSLEFFCGDSYDMEYTDEGDPETVFYELDKQELKDFIDKLKFLYNNC